MAIFPIGLMPFNDAQNDDDVLVAAALTSSSDLDGGTIVGSGQSYDLVKGFSTGDGASIKWTFTAAQQAILNRGCHIHFEVEKNFHTPQDTGVAHRFLTMATGPDKFYTSNPPSNIDYKLDGTVKTFILEDQERDDTHTSFDCVLTTDRKKLYVDGILKVDEARTAQADSDFATIYLGASHSNTEIWYSEHRLRNFYVSTRPVTFAAHPTLAKIAFLGDSILVHGNYNSLDPQLVGTAGGRNDFGIIPTIERELHKAGLEFDYTFHAVAGEAMADLGAQVTDALSGSPTMAVILIGANDCTSGTLTANWETDYQTQITALVNGGVNDIILCTVTSQNAITATDAEQAVNDAYDAIASLVAANSECTMADNFKVLGRHSIDMDKDFTAEDLHPLAPAHKKMGVEVATAIMTRLT